jgi:hypothetical protein
LVDRVRALQATIGNRAVARIASTAATTAVAGPRARGKRVLARQTGLRAAENVTAFAHVAEAYRYDPSNKNKPLKEYADHLMTTVNGMLKQLGSVECNHSYDQTASDSGQFDRTTWTIAINPAKFSKAGATEVGQLTLEEARDVADTIFHESRHSEQYFRIARLQAGRVEPGVTADVAAKKVSADMGIPLNVANAAVKCPLKDGAGAATMITEALDWESITVGRHREYKNNVNAWMTEAKAARITFDGTSVDAKKAGLDTVLAKWTSGEGYATFARRHLAETEKIIAPSTMDERVISNLTKILKKFEALEASNPPGTSWEKLDERGKGFKVYVELKAKVEGLYEALDAAYREHIHEEDAWAIGAAVQAAFTARHEAGEKAKAEIKTATTPAIEGEQAGLTGDRSPLTQPDLSLPTQPDASPPTVPVLVSVSGTPGKLKQDAS